MNKQIQDILDNFDFVRVASFMNFSREHGPQEYTPEYLKEKAKELLVDAYLSPDSTGRIATLGFQAIKWPWPSDYHDSEYSLELIFELEGWDA